MQVWCDSRNIGQPQNSVKVFDKVLTNDATQSLYQQDDLVFENHINIGIYGKITDTNSQNLVREKIGLIDWLVLEFTDWKMIPIENLISECEGTGTKLAVKVNQVEDIQGIAFALEKGVDAIIINQEPLMIEAAEIAKAQRLESKKKEPAIQEGFSDKLTLEPCTISEIKNSGIGERFCIDLTTMLEFGEGMLIGSSASSLALVHGEVLASDFVPSRPFRVNAGPPHSYIMMADGKTKYIAELESGEEILIVTANGGKRIGNIGRLKIEKRPFLAIYWENNYHTVCSIFLQQAETVRLVCADGEVKSVTELSKGDSILCHESAHTRHIGNQVNIVSREI
ncbi:MAG: 3-dehydroquinate synthase II [Candidatus Poseidoniaceae archaeon]|nr:3-dehydroquinate synthase II [Candidatus Poseidoniaceae archaeon]MBL6895513.1 3-dehydroquinate synthase II [Candidatus Poseidoniaceae archaeon]